MSGLPSIYIGRGTACEPEGEYEGLWLQLKWFGCMFQLAIGRLEPRP